MRRHAETYAAAAQSRSDTTQCIGCCRWTSFVGPLVHGIESRSRETISPPVMPGNRQPPNCENCQLRDRSPKHSPFRLPVVASAPELARQERHHASLYEGCTELLRMVFRLRREADDRLHSGRIQLAEYRAQRLRLENARAIWERLASERIVTGQASDPLGPSTSG